MVPISVVGWIVVGVVAWCAVALVLGVVVGRMVRGRDRQVPRSSDAGAVRGGPGPEDRGSGRD